MDDASPRTGSEKSACPTGLTLPEEILRLAELRGGLILRRDLLEAGFYPRQLPVLARQTSLRNVGSGIYVTEAKAPYAEDRYRALIKGYLLKRRGNPDLLPLAGPSSLIVDGLPLWNQRLAIYVAHPHRGHARPGLVNLGPAPARQLIETTLSHDPQGRTFLRTATPRSLVDTARLCRLSTALAAADNALRRQLVTPKELAETARGLGRVKGIGRARLLCALADGAAESVGESVSRLLMHELGLPSPTLQQPFALGNGRHAVVDFWWERYRLAGEFDGLFKYGRENPAGRPPEDVLAAEKEREDELRDLGLHVVRWTTQHLLAPQTLARKIQTAIARSR